jgi:P-type Cu+ transporter
MSQTENKAVTSCYHCGETCRDGLVFFDEKNFCCDGCKVVYELLSENNLCTYYNLEAHSGISPKLRNFDGRFAYLDDPTVSAALIRFKDEQSSIVIFSLPQMHCSSCVWLLEHLYKLNKGILSSRTDFLQKQITIQFNHSETSLRKVVELITTLGYEPLLSLESIEGKNRTNPLRKRVYRIAVAGFCFANIMMLSFPEYFHIAEEGDHQLQQTFGWLNLMLSLPVLIYSGGEFFTSAWQGLKARFLNIDVPLVLSILLTFSRSVYEIVSGTGAGYLDSMSGIIFFMLVGRYFQEKTHYNLHFDRNYKSFFPISILVKKPDGKSESIPLTSLSVGHVMTIHSQELIPADSKLLSDQAHIDYSFVTGESRPVKLNKGEIIYAGGKQTGGSIECEVLKEVSQSYLTGLWNRDAFNKGERNENSSIHKLARNFTVFLLALSLGAFMYWLPTDVSRGLGALTTVLIVACPCALLLSSTFTNGAIIRIFSRNKCYLKNPEVIEAMANTGHVVMDKTGTITNNVSKVRFEGVELDENKLAFIYSVTRQSNHPLSRALSNHLSFCDAIPVYDYREIPGQGIQAVVAGHQIRIGSAIHCGVTHTEPSANDDTRVFVVLDGKTLGYFRFEKNFRAGVSGLLTSIKKRYKLSFISGDTDNDRQALISMTSRDTEMRFQQSPHDKLEYIKQLQQTGTKVAMVGDGLNDAGAIRQSDFGIAISDDVNNFSPACDAILEGSSFDKLDRLFALSISAQRIIRASFVLSLLYNVVGLSFAVQGNLSPVIAAILMPVSSISIIIFTNLLSHVSARRLKLEA